ncbi:LPS-assembly lipoprotein LptE [Salinisphaera orenii]|uniref:LPS-assembly lipoprotein LptE n=1 Tax=Salinisphaera orenii TaxID=856731 RepID=UPI0013A635D8
MTLRSGRSLGRLVVAIGLVALLVALSGCGFHLRGRSPLPKGVDAMQVTYGNNYKVGDPALVRTARQRLREQGRLGGSEAPATLAIKNVSDSRDVTSVTPGRGNVATYAVETSVIFSYSVNGATQIANKKLSISREYTLNETQRLAANTERHQLADSMQKQLVNEIFLRIATYNRESTDKPGSTSNTEQSWSDHD